jgi:anti-sigma B factor antagonist
MKIEAAREGGSAVVRVGGRLDREGAEHLSDSLEDLLRDGVRSLTIDLSTVTYISSAATTVLARWQHELAGLRGEVQLTSLPPAVRETLAIAGWDPLGATGGPGPSDLRLTSWQLPASAAKSGEYQVSSRAPEGTLRCHLHGHPRQLSQAPFGPGDCDVVTFPKSAFGLGLGAIGGSYEQGEARLGELVAVAGCVAYFPSDGARMGDYLVGDGPVAPRAVLASGLSCEGEFSKLVRFSPKPESNAVPLSELAGICLEAAGGRVAGLVIAAETAGLAGVKLRRSPTEGGASPVRFEVPAVREWLSFAPERIHPVSTTLIAGVVARGPGDALSAHLRPLGFMELSGHFHAAVFSYQPLPQRTVELGELVRGLFRNHQLRDVLHLVWDDRGEAGVGESALLRGVAWVSPITHVS